MSRSLWTTCVDSLVSYFKHLREGADESNKYIKPYIPNLSGDSTNNNLFDTFYNGNPYYRDAGVRHDSIRKPILATPEPNHYGNFQCPKSGKLCSIFECGKYCEESISGSEVRHDRGN